MNDSIEIIGRAVKIQLFNCGHIGAAKSCHLISERLSTNSTDIPAYVLHYDEPSFPGLTYEFGITYQELHRQWQISSVRTIFAINDHALQTTLFTVRKDYDTKSGSVPSRQRLQDDMIKLVRIEQARSLLKIHPGIETQMILLGFDTTQLVTNFEKTQRSSIALIFSEIVDLGKDRALGHIGIYFSLKLTLGQAVAVDHIIAALYASVKNDEEIDFGPIASREYIADAGQLPDRLAIVNEFAALYESFCEEVDRTRQDLARQYPPLCDGHCRGTNSPARASPRTRNSSRDSAVN